ncbi:D-glycero-beta-D-manno-heptose-7-phosphate kinase [Thermodesulfobacteriota bacterium]
MHETRKSPLSPETTAKLKDAVSSFNSLKILVIGDIIIDHFIWGSVSRISPEAPVPVVNVTRENLLLGGAANVLNNIYALNARGAICGTIGDDFMGDQLLKLLEELPSPLTGVFKTDDRPTTKKTRIIAQNQQVVRFDREKTGAPNEQQTIEIIHFLQQNLVKYNAIIISDYLKGMINPTLMHSLQQLLNDTNPRIPLIVDPKPGRPEIFTGATVITPNNHEAELMSGIEIHDEKSLIQVAEKLKTDLRSQAVLITRGESGMALLEGDNPLFSIPTHAKEIYDVTGAGDTVIATLALGIAAGLSCAEAAILANFAAGIVVGKLGTATATIDELLEVIA